MDRTESTGSAFNRRCGFRRRTISKSVSAGFHGLIVGANGNYRCPRSIKGIRSDGQRLLLAQSRSLASIRLTSAYDPYPTLGLGPDCSCWASAILARHTLYPVREGDASAAQLSANWRRCSRRGSVGPIVRPSEDGARLCGRHRPAPLLFTETMVEQGPAETRSPC